MAEVTISNPIKFANNAIIMLTAGDILNNISNTKDLNQDNKLLFSAGFIGGATLTTFAIELLLKSIMVFTSGNNSFVKGHELNKLFTAIKDEKLKTSIIDSFENHSSTSNKLQYFLELHLKSFIDWRYFGEDKQNSISINIGAAILLVNILRVELQTLVDNYIKQEELNKC
jgi:hypothetical protein